MAMASRFGVLCCVTAMLAVPRIAPASPRLCMQFAGRPNPPEGGASADTPHVWNASCSQLANQGNTMLCVIDSHPPHYFRTIGGSSVGGVITTDGVLTSMYTIDELMRWGLCVTELRLHKGEMVLDFAQGSARYKGWGTPYPGGGGEFAVGYFD